MIRLERINGKNVRDIIKLRVSEMQKSFVARNDVSIIEAYIAITHHGQAFPFGIYDDETPVGFCMIGFGADDDWEDAPAIAKNNYNLWRFMIDERYQGKGYGKESFWGVIGIASVLVMAAIGVLLIVRVSIVWGSYQMLLEEEEYSRESKENSKHYGYICGVYWCLITAAYLAWSFIGYHWNISWIIWPIAGVVFGAVMGITKALKRR